MDAWNRLAGLWRRGMIVVLVLARLRGTPREDAGPSKSHEVESECDFCNIIPSRGIEGLVRLCTTYRSDICIVGGGKRSHASSPLGMTSEDSIALAPRIGEARPISQSSWRSALSCLGFPTWHSCTITSPSPSRFYHHGPRPSPAVFPCPLESPFKSFQSNPSDLLFDPAPSTFRIMDRRMTVWTVYEI